MEVIGEGGAGSWEELRAVQLGFKSTHSSPCKQNPYWNGIDYSEWDQKGPLTNCPLTLNSLWSIGPVYSELITILLLCLLRTYRKPKTILSPWTGLAQFRCFLIFTWQLIRNYGEWRQKQPKKLYKHLQGMMRRIVDSLKNVISPE